MSRNILRSLFAAALFVATGITVAEDAPQYAKAGFVTVIENGRLWVFRDGSQELADYRKNGTPGKDVAQIGAGPEGMTIKSTDMTIINDYLKASASN